MKTILPISITILFLFAPAFSAIEQVFPQDSDAPEISFHTLVHTNGFALPQYIQETTTISPEDGVILLHKVTTISQHAKLIIQPGTTIAVSEYAGIRVLGTLDARGTKEKPIQFISNEQNETNRNWAGLMYEKTGSGTIEHAVFHHASPSISCSVPEKVTIHENTYLFGNLELYGPC